MGSNLANWFDKLPIETNQHIASFLEYDRDICNFRRICRSTLDAIDADNCSFWRRRFLSRFEKPSWVQPSNARFKSVYQTRRTLLKNGASFKEGDSRRERRCLEVLVDLVVDSFSDNRNSERPWYESKNLEHIKRFLLANNILQIIFKRQKKTAIQSKGRGSKIVPVYPPSSNPESLLYTIQVICAPMLLSLDSHVINYHFAFPDSQRVVYSTANENPIFCGANGLGVNMPFILHNINFWKYHMVRDVESTLYYSFTELAGDERPRWWSSQPKQGEQKLGRHWKGSYAYVERDEIDTLRHPHSVIDQIQDHFAGEESAFSFQDMILEVVDDKSLPWPPVFEQHLKSLAPPPSCPRTRAQKRALTSDESHQLATFKPLSFRFDGKGQDATETFLSSGWINPLPPQQGIPGWQRVTMMKYFEDEFDLIDFDSLWAYEGVMLPGGQIMLGRWWSTTDNAEDMYSGPFILWCVDGPKYDAIDGVE